jgi:hypothetical protein
VDPLWPIVDEAIEITSRRYLDVDRHTPWQMMHGLLAYRDRYTVKQNGKKISALEWISSGAKYRGDAWFQKTSVGGRAHPFKSAKAFEGHPSQFLAIFSMSDLPLDHAFKTPSGGSVTVADIVRQTQADVNAGEEITWTLWALSHYLGPDARWTNKRNQPWSIERLVQMQTKEPVFGAACGGTHGLFALSYARNAYIQTRQPLRGVWLAADQKIKRFVEMARANQNRDGMLSSNYFKGRGSSREFQTRLGTCGHTLEFLMVALPQERLREQWVRNAVYAIAKDLTNHRSEPAECGALYHALDSLTIYRERVAAAADLTIYAEK